MTTKPMLIDGSLVRLIPTPIDIAARHVGARETSRNQGPEIALFWNDTTYPRGNENREPWCSAFVCYCLAEAARQGWRPKVKTLPREAAVRYFLDWCRGRYGVEVWANDGRRLPQAGDIAVFLPRLSHIGFVENVSGRTLGTIEGNTDDGGGREGDGVHRRQRALSFPGWFVRFLSFA
jgi:hypothetical protein